ncbi:MAG: glycosyltransferase family 4 protein [Candidatus Omnitrophica bacterium]|nr:glycosyltransferase family 4 protein [Candidatus Omnitrophota bacterium]
MNILYLTNHLNTGGITSYVLTLSIGLKKRGHNIYVASSGGELLGKVLSEGINFVPIPIKTKSEIHPKILFSFMKLNKLIRKKNIDIIHANTRVTQVLAHLLSRSSGRPYIATCHGFFKRRFFRLVCPCWGKKTIAISAQVKEHLMRDFNIPGDSIEVIHNGIDVEKFARLGLQNPGSRLQAKKSLGLAEGPLVGIIARLSEVKGHTYLIQAMEIVCKTVPDAQLVIAGEGKLEKDLRALVSRLGLTKNVFFIPNTTDTRKILSAMDVFVLPSLHEGLGLALMEAMAAGVAVVGSDIGGIKSLIQHRNNGLLVPPCDAPGLAEAIVELFKDPQKRKLFADSARDFIAANFSQEEMIFKTEGAYLTCLGAKN